MLTYVTSFNIRKLMILTWCFPNFEYLFMEDNNCKHLFWKFYWKGE